MISTESIRGSLDDDWTGGVGLDDLRGFNFVYFLKDIGPEQMVSAQVFPPPETSQVEVEFPHTPNPP